jgi:hypothetical protein
VKVTLQQRYLYMCAMFRVEITYLTMLPFIAFYLGVVTSDGARVTRRVCEIIAQIVIEPIFCQNY